ncbi:MAG: hypothetical protein ACR2JV_04855 [Gaiellales bacterium]
MTDPDTPPLDVDLDAATQMLARLEALVAQGTSVNEASAMALMAEAVALLPADMAWRTADGIDCDEHLRLRWLLRTEALGPPEAQRLAAALRAEGLLGPALESAPDAEA